MIIGGYRLAPLLKKTFKEIGDDRIMSLSAETAYYFFFSLFPLLLFLTPMLGLVGNGRELMEGLMTRLSSTLPPDALSLLQKTLTEIITANGNAGVSSIGAVLAGYAGSSIFGSLIEALNQAYDVSETRPWWKQQVIRLASLMIAAAIIISVTLVFLDGERLSVWVGRHFAFGEFGVIALTIAQFSIATMLAVALGVILLKLLPNTTQKWSHIFVAATLTTTLWFVAMLLFRVYVQHFGSYNKTYGTIGGVIVLLLWMYYTMLVFLCGGELASELHAGTGSVDPIAGEVFLGRIVTDEGPGTPSLGSRKA